MLPKLFLVFCFFIVTSHYQITIFDEELVSEDISIILTIEMRDFEQFNLFSRKYDKNFEHFQIFNKSVIRFILKYNFVCLIVLFQDIEQASKVMEELQGSVLPSSDRGGMHIEYLYKLHLYFY